MMKKLIEINVLMLLLFTMVTGCGNQKEKISISNNEDINLGTEEKEIYNVSYQLDLKYDYSDVNVLNDIFDYIAIIHIDSIDGVSNWNSIEKVYVSPYTYGKATIIAELKGKINSKSINFIRLGGDMPFDEWIKGQSSKGKILESRKDKNNDNTIVRSMSTDDISIENGKTYLAFLIKENINSKDSSFAISALQYGLREVELFKETVDANNIKDLRVKNNTTGKWEKLTDLIKLD